ncbi:pyocin activator PrtN family protein [Escherichia coli]|nr:pyocin activator PrtN family protein [Escherichia coli]EJE4786329.1 pyocin activator PrtN family protein [Escherichia coli]
MNTLFLLMAEFNTPNIELSAVSQKYFGMSPATAEAKANACKLPVPTYRIGTSQKAKRCINTQDLAEYIDKRREEGRIEWEQVRTVKQKGKENH